MSSATLHSVTGPGHVTEAATLVATHRALVGPFERIVHRVSGASEVDEAAIGLPAGPAQAEAVAVRLRRQGVELEWGASDELAGPRELLELSRERGRHSVEIVRADPTLVTELELGAWCQAGLRHRLTRRVPLPPRGNASFVRAAADRAFWAGVRAAATTDEWRRLTASYCALVFHRLAGDGKAGQERIDLDPRRFSAQLRFLRRLGYRPLSPDELLAFHEGNSTLPHRAFVITIDDGTADCAPPLSEHVETTPQLFVSTREVGGSATWLDGEPLLSWDDLDQLSRHGVSIGAHARTHRPLAGLGADELANEVGGSLVDLQERLSEGLPVFAYPNGSHDEEVRAAAVSAGFRAAWTTEKGRNGAGTDAWCLRRIAVHAADGRIAVFWKVLTGEPPPWRR